MCKQNVEKELTGDDLRKYKEFYNNHLVDVILKYWLQRFDEKNGGFFTCYNNLGDTLVSTDKYVWSQGRCTWMYAKLAMSRSVELDDETRNKCRYLANMGAEFLKKYCIMPNGKECAFRLNGDNHPIEMITGEGHAISTFADCFVILGLSACALLENDPSMVKTALDIFYDVERRMKTGAFKTAPDVLPAGWRSHAAPMIMVNTCYELSLTLKKMGFTEEASNVDEVCIYAMKDIVKHFMSEKGIVHECLDSNNQLLDSLYGRHINPGHTNESMWFLIKAAQKFNMSDIIEKAKYTTIITSTLAWDEEFGGMMYYLDRDGGKPKGSELKDEESLARAAERDWDNKLWWPHIETIYTNLLCYSITNDSCCLEQYTRYHDYTFSIFPNPNKDVGEWIQIRNRKGEPVFGHVGGRLPVKDPFHITRGLILLIELLDEMMVK